MILKSTYLLFAAFMLSCPAALAAVEPADPTPIDTVVQVDRVQVTAIKQGMHLRNQPVAATVVGIRTLRRAGIDALKAVSAIAPNFYIPEYGSRMTSSLYVRGLGARIDQPVMGLNIDNVPILNKNNYDIELADAERIEILRGPQSTLYGRNTMGGVINVYTLSPLIYQGVRLGMEYSSGNTMKFKASTYNKIKDNFGVAATLYYTQSDGLFDNQATGKKCDWERLGGARLKLQWRGSQGLRIENTTSFSTLQQGGYPYASVATGQINYNDPCTYDRTNFSNGFTLRYDAARYSIASITSYQYSNDDMLLDQDFTSKSYFTLRQATKEHTVTEDVVIRSLGDSRYKWLFGAFGFYKQSNMNAPVLFKQDGINHLILESANKHDPEYVYKWLDPTLPLDSRFQMPNFGAALYHESNLQAGRWHFTLGIRLDYEQSRLRYDNNTYARYTKTNRVDGEEHSFQWALPLGGELRQSFTEILPKAAIRYEFPNGNNLYASASKGYKAGGFNTQMFSDVLQQTMMKKMGFGAVYDIDKVVTYKPEQSWNYELGGHFSTSNGNLRGDFALFWIECIDQQLTVFPEGTTTGRMMTNAGRTRSLGAEFSLDASPHRNLDLNLAYGYTHATFSNYHNGKEDFQGKRIPYAPEHTASMRAAWTIPTGVAWLGDVVLTAGVRGIGRIWWDEQNQHTQPFYALIDASAGLEHSRYSISIWGRNLGGANYDTFYFVSIENAFLQRGRPRTFGITLNINL